MHGSNGGDDTASSFRTPASAAVEQCEDGLFAQFARHSSNALWIADAATGGFHYLNPAARAWAGNAETGLDGWHDRLHPHDRERIMRQRMRVAAGEPQLLSYRLCDGAHVGQFRETSFLIPADGASGPRVAGIAENMSAELPIYLIDRAEPDGATAAALREAGVRSMRFSPDEFLRVAENLHGGCAIIDLAGAAHEPAAYLHALKLAAPIHALILIGVPGATQADIIGAMKAGAVDYLPHPACRETISAAIAAAPIARVGGSDPRGAAQSESGDRLARLPRREHEVLAGLMGGGTNKTIGRALGISPRTVEAHRAHLMDRLNVRTLTDLIRVAIAAGFQPSPHALPIRAVDTGSASALQA